MSETEKELLNTPESWAEFISQKGLFAVVTKLSHDLTIPLTKNRTVLVSAGSEVESVGYKPIILYDDQKWLEDVSYIGVKFMTIAYENAPHRSLPRDKNWLLLAPVADKFVILYQQWLARECRPALEHRDNCAIQSLFVLPKTDGIQLGKFIKANPDTIEEIINYLAPGFNQDRKRRRVTETYLNDGSPLKDRLAGKGVLGLTSHAILRFSKPVGEVDEPVPSFEVAKPGSQK